MHFAAQKTSCVLGCIKTSVAIRLRQVVLPLCFALIKLHLEHRIWFWGPQHKKDMELLEQVQRRPMKMIRGLKHLFCEERQRERDVGSFRLEKRRLWRLYDGPSIYKEDLKARWRNNFYQGLQ